MFRIMGSFPKFNYVSQLFKVKLSNINYQAEELDIQEQLSEKYSIINVQLLRDDLGRSRGICFVEFKNQECAYKILDDPDVKIGNRPITVSKYLNPKQQKMLYTQKLIDPVYQEEKKLKIKESKERLEQTIYISNLGYTITEADIKYYFKGLEINHIKLLKTLEGRNKGCGFILFEKLEDAEKALKYENKLLQGREITIKQAIQQHDLRRQLFNRIDNYND